jgi:hypothetical protein
MILPFELNPKKFGYCLLLLFVILGRNTEKIFLQQTVTFLQQHGN